MRKYPGFQDVDEMRTRGYDAAILAEQTRLAERGAELDALIAATHEAFAGVALGAGVGLLQANGLDDYASEQQLAEYRASDEKMDWRAIPIDRLNRYSSSLSFFDAEGMRFHLPAFLVADMRGSYSFDLIYNLVQSALVEDQCALLTKDQRAIVRQYLAFAAQEEDGGSGQQQHIRRALDNYWAT